MANGATINANQLNILGEYKGEENEDIEIFISKVELLVRSFNWTPDVTASMVQTRLKGNAATWLQAQYRRRNPDLNVWYRVREAAEGQVAEQYGGLRDLLKVRFKEALNERGAVDAVIDLKQKRGETVDEFHDRVSLAIDRKNFTYTEQEKRTADYLRRLSQDIYTFFAAGLTEEIAQQALGGPTPPTTEEGLLQAARNAEQERKKNKKPKYLAAMVEAAAEEPSTEGACAVQPEGPKLAELAAEIAALRRAIGSKKPGPPYLCYSCGSPKHFSRECPERPENQRNVEATRTSARRFPASKKKTPPKKKGKGGYFTTRAKIGGRVRRVYVLDESEEEEDEDDEDDVEDEEEDDEGLEELEISSADWKWLPNA